MSNPTFRSLRLPQEAVQAQCSSWVAQGGRVVCRAWVRSLGAPACSRSPLLCLAGPDAQRKVWGVRKRRGCAAVRTLRSRLPLALPLPGDRSTARVSVVGGGGGRGGRRQLHPTHPTPRGAPATQASCPPPSTSLRCKSCSGDRDPGEAMRASSPPRAPEPPKVSAGLRDLVVRGS